MLTIFVTINVVILIRSCIFWQGSMSISTDTLLRVSTSIGQVGFSLSGDILGYKMIEGPELVLMTILMILCSILQYTIGPSSGVSFIVVLNFYTIVIGIEIGRNYLLSSTIFLEFSIIKWSDAIMSVLVPIKLSVKILVVLLL